MSAELEVYGGTHGIEAHYDDMHAAGTRIRDLGWEIGEVAVRAHGIALDGDLLASAVLSPGTFARVEAELALALDGPGGLTANAVLLTASGLALQAAVVAYRAVDEALERSVQLRQQLQGRLFGISLLVNPLGTLLITAGALGAGGAFNDLEGFLVTHPDLLEEIVGSAPGLVDQLLPLTGYPANVEHAAGLLAVLYEQGAAAPTTEGPVDSRAPADLAAALQRLERAGRVEDQFHVEQVGSGAEAVYNVYLPGTRAFDAPWAQSDLVQNLGTNFAGVAGADNGYVTSVLAALRRAGVPPGAPVNLVGHSQGGIVAARLAEQMTDPASPTRYDVRTVVTAGSPVDHIALPEQVRVLSLVNEYDIVPRLDGEEYDDRSNHTTIVTSQQTGSVEGNHSLLGLYQPMGQVLVSSDDVQVQAALAPLADFYTGGESRTWRFQLHRD